jgi:hypothetical protein
MAFRDELETLGKTAVDHKDGIRTEEATKTAFVMPFIRVLGYNIFDPKEVVPEFVADVPGKKGEKVDYAIVKDGQPIMLVECKWCGDDLAFHHHDSQLIHYFNATSARFGVLTNGIRYKFYTDLEKSNIMDEEPFLDFNITHMEEAVIEVLKRFYKSDFDPGKIMLIASELKYGNKIRAIIAKEFADPTSPFVKFFAGQVYQGKLTEKVISHFTEIVKKSLDQFINDKIRDLKEPPEPPKEPPTSFGHRAGTQGAAIDAAIAKGGTIQDIAKAAAVSVGRAKSHIRHLIKDHNNVEVKIEKGVYSIEQKKEGK